MTIFRKKMVKLHRLRRGVHSYMFLLSRTKLCEHSKLLRSFSAAGGLSFFTFVRKVKIIKMILDILLILSKFFYKKRIQSKIFSVNSRETSVVIYRQRFLMYRQLGLQPQTSNLYIFLNIQSQTYCL